MLGNQFLQPSWEPIIPHYRNQVPGFLHFHDQGETTRKTSRLEIRNVPTYPETMSVVPGRTTHTPGRVSLAVGSSWKAAVPPGPASRLPRPSSCPSRGLLLDLEYHSCTHGGYSLGAPMVGGAGTDSPVPTLVTTAGEHVLSRHLHADVPIGADADSV